MVSMNRKISLLNVLPLLLVSISTPFKVVDDDNEDSTLSTTSASSVISIFSSIEIVGAIRLTPKNIVVVTLVCSVILIVEVSSEPAAPVLRVITSE